MVRCGCSFYQALLPNYTLCNRLCVAVLTQAAHSGNNKATHIWKSMPSDERPVRFGPKHGVPSLQQSHHAAAGGTQGNLDALATAPAASKQQRFAMEAVREVDRCVTELASALPVDVMPGAGDLSNHALPQQPLHQCLFPGAAPCENFFRATNPYRFSLDGVHLLGCSGQNLHDIMRCVFKCTERTF